jgi:hypothetical protein
MYAPEAFKKPSAFELPSVSAIQVKRSKGSRSLQKVSPNVLFLFS